VRTRQVEEALERALDPPERDSSDGHPSEAKEGAAVVRGRHVHDPAPVEHVRSQQHGQGKGHDRVEIDQAVAGKDVRAARDPDEPAREDGDQEHDRDREQHPLGAESRTAPQHVDDD
jgi:hypothetical protein